MKDFNPMNIDEKITLVSYDFLWLKLYSSEAMRIRAKLGSQIIELEHIGSTAIPNIIAKPIIDIMIGVENLSKAEHVVLSLCELGYEYLGAAGVPGRLYFRLRNEQSFNVALCQYLGEIWINNLLFRDYLRKHTDIANDYSLIKLKAVESGATTLLDYSNFKSAFINKIMNKAKNEI